MKSLVYNITYRLFNYSDKHHQNDEQVTYSYLGGKYSDCYNDDGDSAADVYSQTYPVYSSFEVKRIINVIITHMQNRVKLLEKV